MFVRLEIWHNIMWSAYKASVFSQLARQAEAAQVELCIYQIAETENDRKGLADVNLSLHQYPLHNLFKGSYSAVPKMKLYWQLAKRTATTKADLTILAGFERPEFWMQALILLLRRKKRAVFCDSTGYDNPQIWYKALAKRVFFWMCPYAFCYGERAKQYVMSFGVAADRALGRCQAAWLPASYDVTQIPLRRTAAAPAADHPVFLYVGRLSPEKRLDTLIQAFAQVLPQKPAATLRIIGTGRQEAELKALAATLGCAEKVEFTGGKSGEELYACYLGATVLVLPSWSEPWGLVVNEALHLGCPVIVSDRCGCVPELATNPACGMHFSCGDADELADKMAQALMVFADHAKVTEACLQQIAPFSPDNAAASILKGAQGIVKG
jgi:glycosyltransferase involved in cell wall biosynthesis